MNRSANSSRRRLLVERSADGWGGPAITSRHTPARVRPGGSLYWLTGTAGSSAALYYEDGREWGEPEPLSVPLGVAMFGVQDIALRRDEEEVDNVVHWSEFDRGGHFAAMEAPDLLLADLRTFFADYR
ncbi:hypothetical protein [Streptomyces sp. DH12]|uniref:hypothetical protein n=1 Tax=Streptomyces sp. DH12 TaxID=2857010 RepID=UPI001E463955|nr:hypothetical protein [Streptomyces sp. DH12]